MNEAQDRAVRTTYTANLHLPSREDRYNEYKDLKGRRVGVRYRSSSGTRRSSRRLWKTEKDIGEQ